VIDRPDYFDKLLYLAACGHHVVIMQSLLDRGAVPSSLGRTPLHAVCSSHLSNGESMQKCINLLLEAGCDINAVDDAKRTALHYLVDPRQYSDTKARCCQLLLENGADVMAQDYLGNTPLHLVYRTDIVDILMANGADMNKRNAKGQTPVDTILEAPSRIDIKCLLPYVPNWNIHDSSGDTPLHIIFSKSYHPAAALRDLVNAGADLGKRNKKGEAPIHVLKEISDHGRKDKNFFADLVRAGADLNVRDRDGRTVLLRLLAAGHAGYQNKSVGYALDCGAQIKVVDFEGNGPLHLACNQPQDDSLV
jgi:ankyrin repeat protein